MRRRRIEYGITALILAFFVGLVALNYFAVAALTLGAIISWPAIRLIQFIGRSRTRILWTVIVILIVSNLSLFVLFWSQRVGNLVPTSLITNFTSPISLTINRYYLTIESSNWQSGVIRIRERVDFDPKWAEYYQIPSSIDLPEREVMSTDIGLLTREVRIDPLKAISSGYASITLSDGRMLRAYICFTCGDTIVLLRDAPRGSFLAAKNAEKMERHPYMDTETVSWSVMDLEEGITFAFVPPPFHYIRPIIEPLLGVSTLNDWVLGILGLGGSILLTPIVKPALLNIAQKRFGSWIDQHFEAKVRAETNSKFPRMDLSKPDVIFVIKIPDSSVMVEGAVDQVEKGTLKVVWVKLPELRSIVSDLIHQNAKDYFSQMRFQFNPKSEKWEIACLTLRKSGRTIQGSKSCRPDHPLKVR